MDIIRPVLAVIGILVYMAYAKTVSKSAVNADNASSIHSTTYFQKLPLFAEGEACRENRQKNVCLFLCRPTKLIIGHVLMNTRFSKSERTAVRITRTCVDNRQATSDK